MTQDEMQEESKVEWMTPEIEAEGRRIYASDKMYRGVKYIMGYLKGYKVEKEENFKKNPLEMHVKVWYDLKEEEMEDNWQLSVLEMDKRKAYAIKILFRAIKYIMGYLKGYKMEFEEVFDRNPLEIHVKVWYKEEEKPPEIV